MAKIVNCMLRFFTIALWQLVENGLEGAAGSRGGGAPALSTQAGAWDRHAAESAGQRAPSTRTHPRPTAPSFHPQNHSKCPCISFLQHCNILCLKRSDAIKYKKLSNSW